MVAVFVILVFIELILRPFFEELETDAEHWKVVDIIVELVGWLHHYF